MQGGSATRAHRQARDNATMPDQPDDLDAARSEIERLRRENESLQRQLDTRSPAPLPALPLPPRQQNLPGTVTSLPTATDRSSLPEKISLFRGLFAGRDDVYATLWVNHQTGKKGYAPACKDPWARSAGRTREFLPLTDEVIGSHLDGKITVGLYPLLPDNTCRFLACDFDKTSWRLDAAAFLEAARQHGIPAYLERSRSGNGGHVWLFFTVPVPASEARQLGTHLLSLAMTIRGDMDLASYDRFFPSQDFVPKGGFGNLIALPLQREALAKGNAAFLNAADPAFPLIPDQWAFLSQVQRISPLQIKEWMAQLPEIAVGPDAYHPGRGRVGTPPAPPIVKAQLHAALSLERAGLPPWLLSRLKHLASLHNPVFYERQKLRFSTWNIPRFIRCYDEDYAHLHLPRGVTKQATQICVDAESRLEITDRRPTLVPLSLAFTGTLRPAQERAVEAMVRSDLGVLVAPPGAGKTVIGCAVIARRSVPALVLAHRKPILDQWRKHLTSFLGLTSRQIGQIGGGRNRQSGIVDLGMLQSLARIPDLPALFAGYGLVIVDECHHVPAATFEACLKQASARFVLGLTATPYRRDGLQSLIAMQCGPVVHVIKESSAEPHPSLSLRPTQFSLPAPDQTGIQATFAALVADSDRLDLVAEDIRRVAAQGRKCLILSHWKVHCRRLADRVGSNGVSSFILDGSLGKKEREAILKSVRQVPPGEGVVVFATGQYLGEGFDWPQVDTLFLAFPISFRGKLVQYVGRILRSAPGKPRPQVFDYVDESVPVLRAMASRRLKSYLTLGIHPEEHREPTLFDS